MSFEHALVLPLALLLVPFFIRGKSRLRFFRLTVLVLVVLAASGPRLNLPSTQRNVLVLLDVSASVGVEAYQRAKQDLLVQLSRLDSSDRFALMLVGDRAGAGLSGAATGLSAVPSPSAAGDRAASGAGVVGDRAATGMAPQSSQVEQNTAAGGQTSLASQAAATQPETSTQTASNALVDQTAASKPAASDFLGSTNSQSAVASDLSQGLILPFNPRDQAIRSLERLSLPRQAASESQIAAALTRAWSLLSQQEGQRILLLLSDGRESTTASLDALDFSARGIKVYTVALGERASGVRALSLQLPLQAKPGVAQRALWTVSNDAQRQLRSVLYENGRVIAEKELELQPGQQDLELELPPRQTGVYRYRAVLVENGRELAQSAIETIRELDRQKPLLLVQPLGLVQNNLARSMGVQDLPYVSVGASGLPSELAGFAPYDGVVLQNIAATEFTEAQLNALRAWVEGGGGLLVLGGERSLGRGGYFSSPLEELLPVSTDTRQRQLYQKSQILFVLDHSGSMTETVQGVSKVTIALQGIAGALDSFREEDELAVLGFDSEPNWIQRFTPASNSSAIRRALGRTPEGGGTDLGEALDEVLKAFGPPGPIRRHVVIISDFDSSFAAWKELATKLRSAGISISTIGIGDMINEELMRDLAAWGEGATIRSTERRLPQIIQQQTDSITRELMQEGSFRLELVSQRGFIKLEQPVLDASLDIRGFLLTKLKPGASLNLSLAPSSPAQTGSAGGAPSTAGAHSTTMPGGAAAASSDPLLAQWRYGLGKVVVWTSDTGERWMAPWIGTKAYTAWVSSLVRSLSSDVSDATLSVQASVEDRRVRIYADAISPDRRLMSNMALRVTLNSSILPSDSDFPIRAATQTINRGVQSSRMSETSPGRYEADLDVALRGLQRVVLSDESESVEQALWLWTPGSSEAESAGPDLELLTRLGSKSGGRLFQQWPQSGLETLARDERAVQTFELRTPLLILALLCLLAELGFRTVSFGQGQRMVEAFQASLAAIRQKIARVRRRDSSGSTTPE